MEINTKACPYVVILKGLYIANYQNIAHLHISCVPRHEELTNDLYSMYTEESAKSMRNE